MPSELASRIYIPFFEGNALPIASVATAAEGLGCTVEQLDEALHELVMLDVVWLDELADGVVAYRQRLPLRPELLPATGLQTIVLATEELTEDELARVLARRDAGGMVEPTPDEFAAAMDAATMSAELRGVNVDTFGRRVQVELTAAPSSAWPNAWPDDRLRDAAVELVSQLLAAGRPHDAEQIALLLTGGEPWRHPAGGEGERLGQASRSAAVDEVPDIGLDGIDIAGTQTHDPRG